MSLKEQLAGFDKPVKGSLTHLTRNIGSDARDDVLQEARLAYWLSGFTYNATCGATAKYYAAIRMRGAVLDFWRRQDYLSRRHRKAVKDGDASPPTAIDAWNIAGSSDSPETIAAAAEVHRMLLLASPSECNVLTRYFLDGVPLQAIGDELGLTHGRVSQLKNAGLRRIRERLNRQRLLARAA